MHKIAMAAIVAAAGSVSLVSASSADVFGMTDVARIGKIHAEGAQIYECQADAAGALIWKFREPVATLVVDGKTVGRHYAGPSWELADGTLLKASAIAQAPGATPSDIPELVLHVQAAQGSNRLAAARTIVRTATKGGVASGACPAQGVLLSVPYAADYIFFDAARGN